MSKELKFSLVLKEVPVSVTDAEGVEQTYILRELMGSQRDTYLNEMGGRMKFNAEGKTEGLSNYEGLQSGLLSLSLRDENDELVKKSVLQEWPASVLSSLFDVAQELSGLDKGAEAKAKNDSKGSDSTGTE